MSALGEMNRTLIPSPTHVFPTGACLRVRKDTAVNLIGSSYVVSESEATRIAIWIVNCNNYLFLFLQF